MTIFDCCCLYVTLGSAVDERTVCLLNNDFSNTCSASSTYINSDAVDETLVNNHKKVTIILVDSDSVDSVREEYDLFPVRLLVTSDSLLNDDSVTSLTSNKRTDNEKAGRWAGIFCHSSLISAALFDVPMDSTVSVSCFLDKNDTDSCTNRLLSMIHPFLALNDNYFPIKAVIRQASSYLAEKLDSSDVDVMKSHSRGRRRHFPADILILDLNNAPLGMISELMEVMSCQEVFHSGPELVLKAVLLSQVQFDVISSKHKKRVSQSSVISLPTCPVCLHRIDPIRLGSPKPKSYQVCSKFCPNPKLDLSSSTADVSCPRQRLLRSWPPPSSCTSCHVISEYWNHDLNLATDFKHRQKKTQVSLKNPLQQNHLKQQFPVVEHLSFTASAGLGSSSSRALATSFLEYTNQLVVCSSCYMQETLWVCLTCSFVGCGRYSNKHAAQHHSETNHPFCLELSTGRIWSYADSEYAHRVDLLDCPCTPSSISTLLASMYQQQQRMYSILQQHFRHAHDQYGEASTQQVYTGLSGFYIYKPSTLQHTPEVLHCPRTHTDNTAKRGSIMAYASSSSDSNKCDTLQPNLNHTPFLLNTGQPASMQASLYSHDDIHDIGTSNSIKWDEKSPPKKATLIGEEYEALLRSALEEQANYYEGQITSLRAKLTAEQIDRNTISSEEQDMIDQLRGDIQQLRHEMDSIASKELIEYQGQEAALREQTQRLLQEQRVTQDLIQTIRNQSTMELEQYQHEIDELEYQISDLTTNQSMRYQFEQNDELANAQIQIPYKANSSTFTNTTQTAHSASTTTTLGHSTTNSIEQTKLSGKKGKKPRRYFRK